MNEQCLNQLREDMKQYGEVWDINENYLYITDYMGSATLCYGPWPLVRTAVDIDELAVVVSCQDTDFDECTPEPDCCFVIKDANYGDIYTSMHLNSIEDMKSLTEDPGSFERGEMIFKGFVEDWKEHIRQ